MDWTNSSLLGIVIHYLPLILKQSLIRLFNITSVEKARKQLRQNSFLLWYKVWSNIKVLKTLIRPQCFFPISPLAVSQHVLLNNITTFFWYMSWMFFLILMTKNANAVFFSTFWMSLIFTGKFMFLTSRILEKSVSISNSYEIYNFQDISIWRYYFQSIHYRQYFEN